jgi:endonuclease/exonuclease/phosphatase family metal-dependent hydrolase
MQLITWNVQWCRGIDGRVSPRRIIDEARSLADFDVLCLQEVAANFPQLAGSRGENQFEELASLLPGYTAIAGTPVDAPAPDGTRRGFGNLVFSRYPVLQVLRLLLPWPSDPAVFSMPRMLIDATLATPDGPLRVLTTHLEYYSSLQREAQVEAILAHQRDAAARAVHDRVENRSEGPFHTLPRTASAILVGDFNFNAGDPLHARLTVGDGTAPAAFANAWQHAHPGVAQPHTMSVHDKTYPPNACDLILMTPDLLPRLRAIDIDLETQASDHQPVRLELQSVAAPSQDANAPSQAARSRRSVA